MDGGIGAAGHGGEFGEVPDSELLGRVGTVVTRIPGPGLPGEVLVAVRGGREEFIAYAETAIEPGESVLVTTWRGHRAVDVIPY